MNFRTTLILLILLTGGLVLVYFVNRSPPEEKKTEAFNPKGTKLFDMSADDIKQVLLEPAGAKPIAMVKQEGKWMLTQPIQWPAAGSDYREGTNEFTASELVEALVGLRSRGNVDITSDNSATTGLDKPRYAVELTDKDGKTFKLKIGNRSSLGKDMYVQPEGKNVAELVGGGKLATELDKSPENLLAVLRGKQLVGPTPVEIKQLSLSIAGKKLVLQKTGEQWKIIKPQQVAADAMQVSDLLLELTGLKADEFLTSPSAELSAQFDQPKVVAWISTQAPSTQPTTQPAAETGGTTITVGQFTDVDRNKVYVKVSNPAAMAKAPVADTFLSKVVEASVLSLRDRKVLDIKPSEVSRLTIKTDIPAATQPTTRPAKQSEVVIQRRKQSLIAGPPVPATQPLPEPTSAPAISATTQSAAVAPSVTQIPATQPAMTEPARRAGPPLPILSTWELTNGFTGDANDAQVNGLLALLNPLHAEKFLETPQAATQPSAQYTLVIQTIAPGGGEGRYEIKFIDPGDEKPLIAEYNGLSFEVSRDLLPRLQSDFTPGSTLPAAESDHERPSFELPGR